MADVINTLSDINELALTDTKRFIARAEARYDDKLNEIVDKISKHQNIEIVLLAGPSSSGKTTTANKINEKLQKIGHKAYTISLDDFYRHADEAIIDEDGKPDYETVNALDLDLLRDVLNNLVKERKASIPQYNFDTGRRTDNAREIVILPGDVVILEGLHALNPVIHEFLPSETLLKLYISVSTRIYEDDSTVLFTKRDLRLIRRTVRDFRHRNSSVENTFSMWENVLEGEQKYLAPYKYCADILIDSIHNYEPCVFKERAIELFNTVSKDSIWYNETQRLTEKLLKFETISEERVPEDSLLAREFLCK